MKDSVPQSIIILGKDCLRYYTHVFEPTAVILVPKSETRGFDSWMTSTSSLRSECNFPLATSDVQMMSETIFYS